MANIKAVVTNPARRKVKKRKKPVKRKMSALQLQYFGKRKKAVRKKNPVKRKKIKIKEVVKMARKRRKSVKRTTGRKRYIRRNPAIKRSRRHVRRNPMSFSGVGDILINGAIAGAGAFVSLYLGDIISEKFLNAPASAVDAASKAKRNITTIVLSVLGGWAAMKFIKGKKGDAIAQGMVAGAVLRIGVNMLGLKVGLGEDSNVDTVLDNLLGGELLLGNNDYSDQTLLGMDEDLFGFGEDDDELEGEILL